MHDVDGVNAGYARLLLDEYLDNPEAVPAEWRALFEAGDTAVVRELPGLARLLERLPHGNGAGRPRRPRRPLPRRRPRRPAAAAAPSRGSPRLPLACPPSSRAADGAGRAAATAGDRRTVLLGGVAAAMALVKAHRMHGHLAARARPARLGADRRPGARPAAARAEADARAAGAHPRLDPAHPRRGRHARRGAAAAQGDLLRLDRPTRSSTSATTSSASGCARRSSRGASARRSRPTSSARLYARLCEVEGMERYLRRAFLGQKQFSLEGLDVLIPMLDESLELAAAPARARS